jgi:hypothetical protein
MPRSSSFRSRSAAARTCASSMSTAASTHRRSVSRDTAAASLCAHHPDVVQRELRRSYGGVHRAVLPTTQSIALAGEARQSR